ncbi:MAG: hypothetical protein C0402_13385 [Thermodesulfovibrio sp.]|nr:hypothetical protein [Thermodesulfovibrio sp.]
MTPGEKDTIGFREQGELSRCILCNTYINAKESFTCPRCRKGPLCKTHRFSGRRECTSCVFDLKQREVVDLRKQEQSITDFTRLLQFIFLVFAIFFIAARAGLLEFVDFLKENIVSSNLAWFGILPIAGYLLFYIILYNQRNKIKEIEAEMHAMEFKRMVK